MAQETPVEETHWQTAQRMENRANPYPFYEEMRKTPVHRQLDGSYVISTYREVVQLLHDPRISSDETKRAGAPPNPFSMTVIGEDPPEHDVDRRRMMRHFGPPVCPHMIADFEPRLHEIFTGLLDAMRGKTRVDFVDEYAFPGPVNVICEILGVPKASIPDFHRWIEGALSGLDFGPDADTAEGQRRFEESYEHLQQLNAFLGDLLDQYRKEPGPGMLSGLVNDPGPEGCMGKQSLVNTALLLLFAGHETTVNLIAHSVLTLLRHPDQLEKLRRRPDLIVPAVEEFLRFESSVQFWPFRSALEDVEVAGTTIPKGAQVFLVYGSANRDPARFENPDKVDIERADNQHLGYSQGVHYCFGAPLARLEAQFAVGEFVRRVVNPRLVEDPPPYRQNHLFRGPRHLWIEFDGIRD